MLPAMVLATSCGLGNESAASKADSAAAELQPWTQPVRKAICGPQDKVETSLQGQVPAADRASGRSQEGYNCNLELVGQWQGDGAGWQHAWFDDCAYYGTTVRAGREHPGVVVIDASNRSNPHPSAYLTETPMLDPWESLKVNEQRQLLGADDGADGGGGNLVSIYDVSGDCRQPQLLATAPMGETAGHEGNWMADGNTYWSANGTYNAMDTANPRDPQYLLSWTPPSGTHGLAFSADGMRGFFTHKADNGGALGDGGNGFDIVDTSDIQRRKPDPELRIISTALWDDGSKGQHPIPFYIHGKPYVIYVDETGSAFAGAETATASCVQGMAPWGMPRLFDISDEKNPQLTAKLMLETDDPENCPYVLPDVTGRQVVFSYDSHYCSVDDPRDATALACGFFNSGIRVFDIRAPYFPREIAYFNPPAQLKKTHKLPGSHHDSFLGASGGVLDADWCTAQVRFMKERGELWTTCQDNGFMILKFTHNVWPFI